MEAEIVSPDTKDLDMFHFPARQELEGKQHKSKTKYQRGQRVQCRLTCCLSLPTPTFCVVGKTRRGVCRASGTTTPV